MRNNIWPFLSTWFPCSQRTDDLYLVILSCSSSSPRLPHFRETWVNALCTLCVTCIFCCCHRCCPSVHKFKTNHKMPLWPWTFVGEWLGRGVERDPKTKYKGHRGTLSQSNFRFVCICAQFLPLYFICRFLLSSFLWYFKNWNKRL